MKRRSQQIDPLVKGYQRFRAAYFQQKTLIYKDLSTQKQKPHFLIIACSDSRVDPAIVTNCEPGELFVVRNVANLVPPYQADNWYHGTSAALEFGVRTLGISNIVVFGHTQCGGIAHLLSSAQESSASTDFVSTWMELARPARDTVLHHHADASFEAKSVLCEQYSLINSLHNLQTFPWIAKRIEAGTLSLHAWYFDLSSGKIQSFEPETHSFVELHE